MPEFLSWLSGNTWLVSMRMRVQPLWCKPTAPAPIWTPSLGTSICHEFSPNKTKKKKKDECCCNWTIFNCKKKLLSLGLEERKGNVVLPEPRNSEEGWPHIWSSDVWEELPRCFYLVPTYLNDANSHSSGALDAQQFCLFFFFFGWCYF